MRDAGRYDAEKTVLPTLSEVRERLAELQSRNVGDGRPQFLFRGQRAVYPSIKSTFARIPDNEVEIGQAYTVYRHAKQICQGLRGYTIDHLDGVAVLQHYGWPTPLIDVTGTLEVAVFFALLGASAGSRAIIYVVDTHKLPGHAIVVDHAFLTHTVDGGGFRHRWLRQDGFALATRDWRDASDARELDLLSAPFSSALEAHEFIVAAHDRPELANVLSTADDPLPQQLQHLLSLFCDDQFGGAIAPKLFEIVERMWNPTAAT
jgi:hypothetical protein